MFNKILIANRGEIACRVAATARRMGIRTVAVFSDADARARHVAVCDEAVHIGGASPRESYLCADRILAAARATGAQAIHPGYGFLSENEGFAQACRDAGIAFIGPTPAAIAAMGSKSAAKALMAQAGVPLVPGYHGDRQEPAFLQQQAESIGYPVLIKASAGGGGKGMRIVAQSGDFAAALASCQREARASFGDEQVLIERYVTQPRHIEIQVFADRHGNVIHLGERDCSVQRRHQKVLEEAPAPGMTAELRAQMGAAAVAAARSVGYEGAGTVEFICETSSDGRGIAGFFFMEMNTRLQVEHPVTEAITGLDLVEWQLRVAAGEALPLRQDEVTFLGHAIEARICAENPQQGFLPAVGTLRTLRAPAAARFSAAPVRIDSGVDQGDEISPHYDSMIAKLIVHADDRATALDRMAQALSELQITGLHHNVGFLRRLVATESFRQPRLDTALIEREHGALFPAEASAGAVAQPAHPSPVQPPDWALIGATLRWWQDQLSARRPPALVACAAQAWRDPWQRSDGWALHGASTRALAWRFGEASATVLVRQHRDGSLSLQLPPTTDASARCVRVLIDPDPLRPDFQVHAVVDGQPWRAQVDRGPAAAEPCFDVFTQQGHITLNAIDPLQTHDGPSAGAGQVTAPMPGKVIALLVSAGDEVCAGQPLVVTEAMKMEHTLCAPRGGRVAEVLCAVGDQVTDGAELLRLQPLQPLQPQQLH